MIMSILYTKIAKFTSIFYRIRHRLSCELLKMLYFAFIHSHLSYGVEAYGNSYQTCMNRLIVVNNKILRILQNQSLRTHVCELYVNYNALTIPAFA